MNPYTDISRVQSVLPSPALQLLYLPAGPILKPAPVTELPNVTGFRLPGLAL
jgi:hypothetical protein